MESSKRRSSGTTSNASETGSTVGSRIAKTSSTTKAIRRLLRSRSRRQDAKPYEPEHEDRHQEGEPAGEQRQRGEGVVVARADLDVVELLVVRREEVERAREHDEVHERDPADEQGGREHDEDEHDAFEVRLDGRREERPDLPEEHRAARARAPAIRLTLTDVVNGSVTPSVTSFLSFGSGPVSHSMICSWNANVTRKIGTIARSAMMSRERSSSRCSTSVASSPWSRRRGSHRRSTRGRP